MSKFFVLLVISLLFYGCATTVKLAVENGEDYPLAARVVSRDRNNFQKAEISLGEVAPKGKAAETFEVENGGSFAVIANIPQSGIIYSGDPISVTGKTDPLSKTVVLKNQGKFLDDSLALERLSKSFKNLGPDIGASPVPLKDALPTYIGALVVATPGSDEELGKILYTMTPETFGVKVLKLEDVTFPDTAESEQVQITGKASTQAGANIATFATFDVTYESESIYELKWVMKGFGPLYKEEDPDKHYVKQYNNLERQIKDHITQLLNENKDARVYYINRFYVLNNAELFVKKGQKVAAKAQFNAKSVVTGSAVYSFEESKEQRKSYGDVVLNFWGEGFMPMTTKRGQIGDISVFSETPGLTFLTKGNPDDQVDVLVTTGSRMSFRPEMLKKEVSK